MLDLKDRTSVSLDEIIVIFVKLKCFLTVKWAQGHRVKCKRHFTASMQSKSLINAIVSWDGGWWQPEFPSQAKLYVVVAPYRTSTFNAHTHSRWRIGPRLSTSFNYSFLKGLENARSPHGTSIVQSRKTKGDYSRLTLQEKTIYVAENHAGNKINQESLHKAQTGD